MQLYSCYDRIPLIWVCISVSFCLPNSLWSQSESGSGWLSVSTAIHSGWDLSRTIKTHFDETRIGPGLGEDLRFMYVFRADSHLTREIGIGYGNVGFQAGFRNPDWESDIVGPNRPQTDMRFRMREQHIFVTLPIGLRWEGKQKTQLWSPFVAGRFIPSFYVTTLYETRFVINPDPTEYSSTDKSVERADYVGLQFQGELLCGVQRRIEDRGYWSIGLKMTSQRLNVKASASERTQLEVPRTWGAVGIWVERSWRI